ncbi:PREDICTED: uncharacterized protein LOC104717958 [Camelina sativa]|uniref:Uncharacterized protein LOC104717958 n=1 Tax=Camelina sativa TaxID=90675 RepID=A0ABM0U044_CAMSA|nr:PREDICTED: uncharacterized protein LOC104717958 [Camelina sativa]
MYRASSPLKSQNLKTLNLVSLVNLSLSLSMHNVNSYSPGELPDGMENAPPYPSGGFPFSSGNFVYYADSVVSSARFGEYAYPAGSYSGLKFSFTRGQQCWVIGVDGFETSLPADDIKKALKDHFRSCGVILNVELPGLNNPASVIIVGDDANDKALELNGSGVGGRKLVVTAEVWPMVKISDGPVCFC